MKHYKLNNEVFAYESDGTQDHLVTSDMVLMTTAEFELYSNPPLTDEQRATAYVSLRQEAYPSIADQLDTIYHQGLDAWKATILAVKEEFPK